MWKKTLTQSSSVYLICKLIVQFSFLKVLILSSFLITYFIHIVHLVIKGLCIQGNRPQTCTEMTVKLGSVGVVLAVCSACEAFNRACVCLG